MTRSSRRCRKTRWARKQFATGWLLGMHTCRRGTRCWGDLRKRRSRLRAENGEGIAPRTASVTALRSPLRSSLCGAQALIEPRERFGDVEHADDPVKAVGSLFQRTQTRVLVTGMRAGTAFKSGKSCCAAATEFGRRLTRRSPSLKLTGRELCRGVVGAGVTRREFIDGVACALAAGGLKPPLSFAAA